MRYNKYSNKKVAVDGIKFDSKREATRYQQLKQMQQAGLIKELELQKEFELQPKFRKNGKAYRNITYRADFYYFDNKLNKYIVEDTKGYRTDIYKLKKKLFEYKNDDLEIKEI